MNRIQELIASVSEQLEAMSTRDRNLLTGLICVVAVLIVGGITYTLHGVLQDRASRVIDAKQHLVDAQELAGDYVALRQRIEAAEARMSTFRPAQVNTYLETWATNAGVIDHLRTLNETGSRRLGDYMERDYTVNLQRAELPGVLKFLYAIETSPYPLKITNAQFRVVRTRDDRFIDLNLGLQSHAKEEG